MKVRVVLLPDKKLDDLAKKYSSSIVDKFPAYFRLDATHISHATITALEFDDNSFSKINDIIKNLSNKVGPINVVANEVKTSTEGFIGMYFKDDLEIIKLSEKMINLLKPYNQENLRNKVPHVTLIRLRSGNDVPDAIDLIKDFPKKDYTFGYLAICEEGENSTCKSIMAKFPLKKI